MSDPFYRTAEWRRLRVECIRRHPVCATSGCNGRSVVADHIIPRSQGGGDEQDNLVGRCITCHNARRGTGEPRLPGCEADGTPRDRAHWWNAGSAREISHSWEARTASHHPKAVSSGIVPPKVGTPTGG
jgi:hypothetical protein